MKQLIIVALMAALACNAPQKGYVQGTYYHSHYDIRCDGTQIYQTTDQTVADSLARYLAQRRAGSCDVYIDWDILHWDSLGAVAAPPSERPAQVEEEGR